jgi:hypothetical protein
MPTPGSRSIRQFITRISKLPSDKARITPGKWYRTQKEHWLGWLRAYHTPGAYGRIPNRTRDAEYAYNHIVEPKMLLWLIQASDLPASRARAAKKAATQSLSMPGQSAAIRREVPWAELSAVLWPQLK